jgi:hypothetical protein
LRLRRLWGRRLLRIVGYLPLLLRRGGSLPTQSTNEKIEMAGSDKVDPAIPCRPCHVNLAMSTMRSRIRIIRAPADAAMMPSRIFNPFKKC